MSERITFRKGRSYSGRMRLAPTYRANRGGKEIAIIQNMGIDDLWFWYGDGVNTAQDAGTLERCKQQVKEHFSKTAPQSD